MQISRRIKDFFQLLLFSQNGKSCNINGIVFLRGGIDKNREIMI